MAKKKQHSKSKKKQAPNGDAKRRVAKPKSEVYYERQIEQLTLSNQNLQEFAYLASHDLKEPLRKIATFGERLAQVLGSELNTEGKLYLDKILNSTKAMQKLLEDLLNFSRLSSERIVFEKTDLNKLLLEAIKENELLIEETGAKIVCGNLPELEAYPSQIKQLFYNLLHNALKFRNKEVSPLIEVSCKPLKQNAAKKTNKIFYQLTIKDNGIGFEQQYAERIFLLFQRLNAKAEYPGAGLGLAICKKITDNHKGSISALSAPGNGTTFTIILPKKQN